MICVIAAQRPLLIRLRLTACSAMLAGLLTVPGTTFALSELKQIPGQAPPPPQTTAPATPKQDAPPAAQPSVTQPSIPLPDPLVNKQLRNDTQGQQVDAPPPAVEVLSDMSKVPAPVARMRQLIVEAAASGDIERLRPLLGKGPTQTEVSDDDVDPVAVLKGQSGDADGIEIMAILLDVLSTGFVHLEKGTPDEMYVWPYFVEKPLSSLTKPEKVDLLRIVTAGDFAAMEEFGSYNFYRVGITKDGQWKFFVGGD